MSSRNLTITLPEDLVRRAKIAAAQRDTSLSAMIRNLLEQGLGDTRSDEDVWADEERAMTDGLLRIGEISWSRENLHERG